MNDRPALAGSQGPILEGSQGPVVLASASRVRRDLLRNAGVPLLCDPSRVDEAEIKISLRGEGADAAQAAETLAELKARQVAPRHAGSLVIGADQILECAGVWFDKPATRQEAAQHLKSLGGRGHALWTGVCVWRDGTRLWHHNAVARLEVRPLSAGFIAAYLEAAGESVLTSVGGYRLEGLGAQLFSRIEGDYFTVLGLPLLPLLGYLRGHKAIPQ